LQKGISLVNIRKRKMPRLPAYPVPALEKGLDLLEALAAAAVPQSLAGLAARQDRSSSELFRMLNCLERRGYVARDPVSGKYGLSLKLYALAHGHSVADKLLTAARGPMRALTERVRESCHLSLLERGRLLVVAQEECPEPVRLSIEVGGVFDPVATASGRLLLAHLGPAARAAAVAATPAGRRLDARGRARLEAELARVRRRGVSVAESESVEGVQDLAVLVGGPDAHPQAALTVTRLRRRRNRPDAAALLAAVRAAARAITAGLGLSP
jgi:DNA-binding IclR family transcriptional regulator